MKKKKSSVQLFVDISFLYFDSFGSKSWVLPSGLK